MGDDNDDKNLGGGYAGGNAPRKEAWPYELMQRGVQFDNRVATD
jgi:hypothetical protein